jgi:predicted Zn-dependent protease
MATFEGGVFSEAIAGGRAGATLSVDDVGVTATTPDGQPFRLTHAEMSLEMGGASGHMLFLRNGARTVTIFSDDRRFAEAVRGWGGGAARQAIEGFDRQLAARRRQSMILWGVGIAALAGLVLTAPALYRGAVRRAVTGLPASVDEKLGMVASESLLRSEVVVSDPLVKDAMDKIMARLEAAAPKSEFKYRVHVVRAPEVNAFALPGGTILVNTALLERAKDPEQVAGVLAHEMAHVTERHTMERLASSLTLVAGVSLLVGDVSGLLALGVQLSETAAVNTYGRAQENDSDRIAVGTLHRAGLKAAPFADFFRMLEAEGKGDLANLVPEWLQTHAENQKRVDAITAEASRLGATPHRPLGLDWPAIQARLASPERIGESPPAK